MKESDHTECVLQITTIWACFPSAKPLDDALLEGYWFGLKDLDLAAIKQATVRAIRTCKFFPTVGELRILAGEETPQQRAALAWKVFMRERCRLKTRKLFEFDDPVLTATIKNLGESRAAYSTGDEEVWLRKDFERLYAMLCDSAPRREALAGLGRNGNLWHDGGLVPLDEQVYVVETGLPWAASEVAALETNAATRPQPMQRRTGTEQYDHPRRLENLVEQALAGKMVGRDSI